ncbi:MAG TPA: helix-turn-helix domain-containing protein [Thermobifida alba]|nr:helix-turn-helix domain-containing protein [Thermobifida alba]
MSTPLLSASAAADLLGVSPTTIARWANSGKLAYMRTPAGHRRFSLEVIEQLRAPAEGGAVSSSAAHHRIIRAPHPDMVQVEADPAGTVLIPAPGVEVLLSPGGPSTAYLARLTDAIAAARELLNRSASGRS